MPFPQLLNTADVCWITHEFAPFRGGAGVYVEEVARAAAKLGAKSLVLTVDYRGRLEAQGVASMQQSDTEQTFEVVRLHSSGRLSPSGIFSLARGLYGLRDSLQKSSPVLLSVGAQMAAFLLYAGGMFPAERTVCFFHGSELLRFARHPLWRPLARRFYAHAAGFAAASNYVRGLALSSGLLPAGAAILLAPCAVPSAYQAHQADAPAADITQSDGKIRVLTVGRLHPRKGQVEVARALALLPPAQRTRVIYQMVGVGDPKYRECISDTCKDGQIRCEFLGNLDDAALPAVYVGCSLYAQASRTMARSVEGFGISLLEAGYFGRPIAAFNSGGIGEAVLDGRTASLVAEGDVRALSVAISELIMNPALAAAYGLAGKAHAGNFSSWETAARTFLSSVSAHGS